MAERRMAPPEAAVDPPPGGQHQKIHAREEEPVPVARFVEAGKPQPAGPQAWAVVLTVAGLYYVWTRVLGKSLPSFAQGGHRVGANKGRGGTIMGMGAGGSGGGNRQAEVRAARERQQQRLQQTAARARESACEGSV